MLRVVAAALMCASAAAQDPNLNCDSEFTLEAVDPNAPFGFIHDIIGKDGALVLSVMRNPQRFEFAANKLREAGIIATRFPAADKECEHIEDITRGCYLQNVTASSNVLTDSFKAKQGWGWGCLTLSDAACTEAHHRAIEAAQYRHEDWTLIMEDDAVPVDPANFDASMRAVWPKVPEWAKVVRLGFCDIAQDPQNPGVPNLMLNVLGDDENEGTFRIVSDVQQRVDFWHHNEKNYDAGMCQTAYMVHRSAIPDILGLFPCPCIIDCCLTSALFDRPIGPNGEPWGMLNMVSIDLGGSSGAEASRGWNKHPQMVQFGPIVQDNRNIATQRINPSGPASTAIATDANSNAEVAAPAPEAAAPASDNAPGFEAPAFEPPASNNAPAGNSFEVVGATPVEAPAFEAPAFEAPANFAVLNMAPAPVPPMVTAAHKIAAPATAGAPTPVLASGAPAPSLAVLGAVAAPLGTLSATAPANPAAAAVAAPATAPVASVPAAPVASVPAAPAVNAAKPAYQYAPSYSYLQMDMGELASAIHDLESEN